MDFFRKITRNEYLVLVLILVLGFCLRMFQLSHQVTFDYDQEVGANFAREVLKVYPIQMIGQGLSVQGLFMGPWYFYFLVPFFAMTSLHPIGGFVGSVVLGLFTIATFFFLLRDVFGPKVAATAAFFEAILLMNIKNDWLMTPGFSSQAGALVIWYCLYKIYHGQQKFYLPLGLFLSLITGFFHPSLFPLFLVAAVLIFLKKQFPRPKFLLGALVLFILPIVPLLLFEYFRHFMELKVLFSLKGASTAEAKTIKTLIDYSMFVFNFPAVIFQISGNEIFNKLFSGLADVTLLILVIKKVGFWKDKFHVIIFVITTIVFLGMYFVLPTHVPDYYFVAVQTLVFIYLCASFCFLISKKSNLTSKFVFATVVIVVTIVNFSGLVDYWNRSYHTSLYDKEIIVKKIHDLRPDNEINVALNTEFSQQFGFKYLLDLYGVQPKWGEGKPTYSIVLPLSRAESKIDFSSGAVGLELSN